MVLRVLTVVSVLLLTGDFTKATAGDEKKAESTVAKGGDFVEGKGTVFGVEIGSRGLFDLLMGSEPKVEEIKCPGCQEAIKSNGVCSECKVGFVKGRMYRSPFAYTLAKGELLDPSKYAGCTRCKEAMAKNEFCKSCNVGFVADRVFKSIEDHHYAASALETIKRAAAKVKECETCATAIVTNGNCPKCKIAYREQRAAP